MVSKKIRDVIIIGGGFAGLTAAMWLGRYRRDVLVISSGPTRNAASRAAHGYPGHDGEDPKILFTKLQEEVQRYGAEQLDDYVKSVEKAGEHFIVHTDNEQFTCRRLLIATGTKDEKPDLPDFEHYDGVSAWHCPACDGYEYSNKKIAVLAWGEQMAGYALEFLAYSRDITVLTGGNAIEDTDEHLQKLADNGIQIIDKRITQLQGRDGQLEAIAFDDGATLECDGLFYSIDHQPKLHFFEQLGCDVEDSHVVLNHEQATSVPGVYAAGDIAPLLDLVVVAAATGAIAASSIHKSLVPETQSV